MGWTTNDIPDQSGRTMVVTGANSGLGAETARALARAGAEVVLACRDVTKGEAVAADLGDRVTVRRLDLADLASVRAFADEVRAEHERIDVLVNNAGVMAVPLRRTADGFEMQIGTNHFGHFALTGLLLDPLTEGRDPRVVTVSSINHRQGRLRFDDLTGERRYSPMAFYNQSKLANAVFGWELHQRLTAAGSPLRSILAHPGYTATNLQTREAVGLWRVLLGRLGNPLLAQDPAAGALPQLYAATGPAVPGGQFIGPDGFAELRGRPTPVRLSPTATDAGTGRRLWELSERLTGVRFPLPAAG